jgi:hypothetical protein
MQRDALDVARTWAGAASRYAFTAARNRAKKRGGELVQLVGERVDGSAGGERGADPQRGVELVP